MNFQFFTVLLRIRLSVDVTSKLLITGHTLNSRHVVKDLVIGKPSL